MALLALPSPKKRKEKLLQGGRWVCIHPGDRDTEMNLFLPKPQRAVVHPLIRGSTESHTPSPQTVSCVLPVEDHPHHWVPSAHAVQLGSKRLGILGSRCGLCKVFAAAGLHGQFARPSLPSKLDARKFQEQALNMRNLVSSRARESSLDRAACTLGAQQGGCRGTSRADGFNVVVVDRTLGLVGGPPYLGSSI